jgi:aldehyde dehydrogenase (NAD+)
MAALKRGPCLAAGSVSILKTSEKTPLTALYMASLAKEAGFPPGVLQVLSGYGDVGEYLVKHPDVDKVAFTGSTKVGLKIS